MMMKWKIDPVSDTCWWIVDQDGARVAIIDGGLTHEEKFNANLIAHAPDLLAMLADLVTALKLDAAEGNYSAALDDGFVKRAERLINRATGKGV